MRGGTTGSDVTEVCSAHARIFFLTIVVQNVVQVPWLPEVTEGISAHARTGQSSFSKGLLKIIKNRYYDGLKARKHNIRVLNTGIHTHTHCIPSHDLLIQICI